MGLGSVGEFVGCGGAVGLRRGWASFGGCERVSFWEGAPVLRNCEIGTIFFPKGELFCFVILIFVYLVKQ